MCETFPVLRSTKRYVESLNFMVVILHTRIDMVELFFQGNVMIKTDYFYVLCHDLLPNLFARKNRTKRFFRFFDPKKRN